MTLLIISVEMQQYVEAEDALAEASRLDATHPLIWGYLALVSLLTGRPDESMVAAEQAIRFKLSDTKVWYTMVYVMCSYACCWPSGTSKRQAVVPSTCQWQRV